MKKWCGVLFLLILSFNLKAESRGYPEWLERRNALAKDKSVARYYTFEDVKDSKSAVPDLGKDGKNLTYVPYKDPATKEVFDDLQVIEGRWPEKTAVRLDRGFYQGETFNIENKQFTAEVWFRRQGPGSILPASNVENGTILAVSGYTRGWRIVTAYGQLGTLSFNIGQPAGCASVSTKTPLPDNVWHHLAVTWNGSDMKVYVNGKLADQSMTIRNADRKLVKTDKFTGEYVATDIPFKIGYSEHGVGSVKLDVDEVVIYNRALSAKEIEKLGKGPSGVSREEVFSKADAFIKAGDYKSARAEYGKLTGLPSYGKELALFNIAESYRLEKDYAGAHKTYKEIFAMPNLTAYYRIYGLFQEADVYLEQKDYNKARLLYEQVMQKTEGASGYHIFTAQLKTGDTYKAERKYSKARSIYETLLRKEETSVFPDDGRRLDVRDRLESIEGLTDGTPEKSLSQKRLEWVNSPKYGIYVSLHGNDKNPGTKENPFATIKRAQEEIRKIKEKGMPEGGMAVYLRAGSYFLTEPLSFGKEDSGTEKAPVIYRSYPGEDVRIAGGVRITGFKPLADPGILKRLPEESKGKVWVADLKSAGITDYGKLLNRGFGAANPAAMELIYNGKIMQLARWPNDSWLRVAALVDPKGDYEFRKVPYQKGKFVYSGDRPDRWKEEKEIWLKGYMGVQTPYAIKHLKVTSIDTGKKIIYVEKDPRFERRTDPAYVGARIAKNHPYFSYNLLSEIDMPGEWYLDRSSGKLYFYPPGKLEGSETIGTMFETPLIQLNNASHIAFFGLTVEGGRSHAFSIKGGMDNLIASSVIRNAGQWAVMIESGWGHGVVGCDIYDVGEGGVSLNGGDRIKLIPAGHLSENNHIYRFNRFCGGYRQGVSINGIGQRVSYNVIHDSPHQAIYFNANDHIVEFNELHDAPYEGREIGAMYIYGEPWYLMSRGTVIRNNFFHHISTHSSPNLTHGLNAIHIDAMNAGIVIEKNIFYRFPQGISSTYPGNYLTNNLFIDGSAISISQGDRSFIFCAGRDIDGGPNLGIIQGLARRLKSVNYKQPPWNYRYPPLVKMMEKEPAVWGSIQGSIIERNVNTGGRFIAFARGIQATTFFENNWDGVNPLFIDRKNMDFRFRPGSPVFGLTGCEPPDMDSIGVYKDGLRVSWPINRKKEDIGKYYKLDGVDAEGLNASMPAMKRINPPAYYEIPLRKTAVTIDGKLEREEWLGLDMKKAMVIEQYWDGKPQEAPKSYAWLLYDDKYLYLAVKNEPDPWTEGMPVSLKEHTPIIEVSFESQTGPHSRGWWMEDMPTGPIYTVWGHFNGKIEVMNIFGLPYSKVIGLEKSIDYRQSVLDKENLSWTTEWKIPFSEIGIDPAEAGKLCFNIGVWKRAGWFAWVSTGSSIWRVENAGFIKFAK